MQLAIFAYCGESFLFDRGRSKLDTLQTAGIEDIYAGVDAVTHEFDWFLDKPINSRRMAWLVDKHSVFRRFLNFGDYNGSFVSMSFVKVCKLVKRVVADDIRIEDTEWRVIFSKSFFSQFEWASRPKWFRLDREFNLDIIFFLILQHNLSAIRNISITD